MSKKYLSVFGVGPIYFSVVVIITCILLILNANGILPVYAFSLALIPLLIGILFILVGVILWVSAVVFSKITAKIKSNTLITNGVFAYVRNPIYSAFMFICSGIIISQNNLFLFIAPVIYWLFLTVLMIKTEEKWLINLYKDEYSKYCKKVNRCIPFIKLISNHKK